MAKIITGEAAFPLSHDRCDELAEEAKLRKGELNIRLKDVPVSFNSRELQTLSNLIQKGVIALQRDSFAAQAEGDEDTFKNLMLHRWLAADICGKLHDAQTKAEEDYKAAQDQKPMSEFFDEAEGKGNG